MKSLPNIILGIIIGALVVYGVFYLYAHPTLNSNTTPVATSTEVSEAMKAKQIVDAVSQLIIVPQGEDPLIATINDADNLIKDQPFYTGAINGDIVLIYQNAAKAIIYSPSRNIIVNVGPVLPEQQASSTAKVSTTTATTTKKK